VVKGIAGEAAWLAALLGPPNKIHRPHGNDDFPNKLYDSKPQ